jgi:hypothetical protein
MPDWRHAPHRTLSISVAYIRQSKVTLAIGTRSFWRRGDFAV